MHAGQDIQVPAVIDSAIPDTAAQFHVARSGAQMGIFRWFLASVRSVHSADFFLFTKTPTLWRHFPFHNFACPARLDSTMSATTVRRNEVEIIALLSYVSIYVTIAANGDPRADTVVAAVNIL